MASVISFLTVCSSNAAAQTIFQWNGTNNTTWTDTTNWTSGSAPGLGSSGSQRINVYNAAGSRLIYNSPLTTTFANTSANGRGLVVGNITTQGFLEIQNGTISTAGSLSQDVIGNTSNSSLTSTLFINGGNYISGTPGLILALSSDTVQLNIASGSATVTTLQLAAAAAVV